MSSSDVTATIKKDTIECPTCKHLEEQIRLLKQIIDLKDKVATPQTITYVHQNPHSTGVAGGGGINTCIHDMRYSQGVFHPSCYKCGFIGQIYGGSGGGCGGMGYSK